MTQLAQWTNQIRKTFPAYTPSSVRSQGMFEAIEIMESIRAYHIGLVGISWERSGTSRDTMGHTYIRALPNRYETAYIRGRFGEPLQLSDCAR